MTFLIGTDEAGYGPNLGPLVVSASVWRVGDGSGVANAGKTPQDQDAMDLYAPLARVVSPDPAVRDGERRLAIADSKRLYKPGGGLAQLECGLLAMLETLGRRPRTWRQAWQTLAADALEALDEEPWNGCYSSDLPMDADNKQVLLLAKLLAEEMTAQRVELVALESSAVFAGPFNRLIDEHGNKATALSLTTLALVRSLMDRIRERKEVTDDEPIRIVCDKHGGRDRYRTLLQYVFGEELVLVVGEGRTASTYRWESDGRAVEISFRAGGEAFLPAALASMASKYLRELAMRALNEFWCARVEGLRPTAGYPVDARRFKSQIAETQQQLGIADHVLWRCR